MHTDKSNEGGPLWIVAEFFTASVIAAIIFYSMAFAAEKVVTSRIYRQSRIISMLVQQDMVSISGILEDTRDIELAVKFAGALTTAYINFEMIPVNEASTFVEVFESVPDGVDIEKFEYRRKDLVITGSAENSESYAEFITRLRERQYFSSVAGSSYKSENGGVTFDITCAAEIYTAFAAF